MTRALVVLACTLLLSAACSSGTNRPGDAGETPGQTANQRAALWVVTEGAGQGGRAVPFENGTAVALGDVDVEMFIAPYPPAREGSIDILVTNQATGAPVEEGALEIIFDMQDMPHGNIRAEAVPSGAGHYLVPYLLVMAGTWEVNVTLTQADAVRALAFIFKVD